MSNIRKRTRVEHLEEEILAEILEMTPGSSIRKISECLSISRGLVQKVQEKLGCSLKAPATMQSKLMNYKDEIIQRVTAGLTATRILREIKDLGYTGGKTILSEMVSALRSQASLQKRKQVKRRFETPAGLELQADWSPGMALIANKLVGIHVLGMVLCSSRKLFYSIHRNEQMPTLLEGLATGFEYFGGCTVRCVFDNMTTIVLGRIDRDRKPIWNPRFIEFARYYGTEPFLCAVRDPNRNNGTHNS
jgi:transposase